MMILILNWRDIKNPASGGAEVLTHEMAKRFVLLGNQVYMFSSMFKGAKEEETVDGVKIYRKGSPGFLSFGLPVHLAAVNFYKSKMQGEIDVVIDEIHGIPFFTPFYVREKKVALICEVAGQIWDSMFPFPLNIIGRLMEKIYFYFYKKVYFLTISQSSKRDLIEAGISSSRIKVLPMGINRIKVENIKKEKDPVLIFVGRLNRMKGIEDAIQAFIKVYGKIPSLKFWIVGRGEEDYVSYLKKIVEKNNLTKQVKFWGFVSEKKKFELMARAKIIVVTSIKEGFGLIVPEAGSVGTPAIVYNVSGLRDIVSDGINGIKLKENSPSELARAVVKILENKSLYDKLKYHAEKRSAVYNWDSTVNVALEVLKK